MSDTGRDNTESNYMDIERFAPNAGSTPPAVIQTLPATVELTGFSGRRHYLEQQTTFDPSTAIRVMTPLGYHLLIASTNQKSTVTIVTVDTALLHRF